METAVSPLYGRPLLTRVSLKYRFTSITIDKQIKTLDGNIYDIIFVGTDDGKVIKFINVINDDIKNTTTTNVPELQTIILSEVQALPIGMPIKELTINKKSNQLIVIGNGHIISIPLYECNRITKCYVCLNLQDPYCIWDSQNHECTNIGVIKSKNKNHDNYIQDVRLKNKDNCKNYHNTNEGLIDSNNNNNNGNKIPLQSTHGTVSSIGRVPNTNFIDYTLTTSNNNNDDMSNSINGNKYPDTGKNSIS